MEIQEFLFVSYKGLSLFLLTRLFLNPFHPSIILRNIKMSGSNGLFWYHLKNQGESFGLKSQILNRYGSRFRPTVCFLEKTMNNKTKFVLGISAMIAFGFFMNTRTAQAGQPLGVNSAGVSFGIDGRGGVVIRTPNFSIDTRDYRYYPSYPSYYRNPSPYDYYRYRSPYDNRYSPYNHNNDYYRRQLDYQRRQLDYQRRLYEEQLRYQRELERLRRNNRNCR